MTASHGHVSSRAGRRSSRAVADQTGQATAKSASGLMLLMLASWAFAGLGLELALVHVIEPALGWSMETYTPTQRIIHWTITCLVWLVVGLGVIELTKRFRGPDLWAPGRALNWVNWAGAGVCVAVSFISHWLTWDGVKPVLELERLGALLFVFQYLYYALETFLMSLIVVLSQLAIETWTRRANVPWGGIILGLSWGVMHVLSKGSLAAGVFAVLAGFLYGAAYLVMGRDYRWALPLMYVMFVL